MTESMACGTPVVGYHMGSVPEVIEDGVTGYVIDPSEGVAGLIRGVEKVSRLNRFDCRRCLRQHGERERHKSDAH